MGVWMIADITNIDRETIGKLLHEDLKMTKVCAKVVQQKILQMKKNWTQNEFDLTS